MVAPRNEGDRAEGSDRQGLGGDQPDESMAIGGSGSSRHSDAASRSRRLSSCLTERLRDVLRDETNGDLLLERSDVENGVLQWPRALDLQVLGACRADERLKPLLKLKLSSGAAEDRLMAHMSQYFEASEVAMLARCLCVPLVSIRVGKVNKQGNLLCPTSTRGHLNLSLLPSSNMLISFTGDDGYTERLAAVTNDSESAAVTIKEISDDSSGRSFLLQLPGSRISYFWCSEKSKLHGIELLAKMKDLLSKKPSLSHLTGISESRLESFATHLRAYLGSSDIPQATSTASSLLVASSLHVADSDLHSSSTSSCDHPTAAHMPKGHPFYQGSLSARSNNFEDGTLRSLLSNRSRAKEKLKRCVESYSSLSTINNKPVPFLSTSCKTNAQSTIQCEDENSESSIWRSSGISCSMPCCLPEITWLSSPLSSRSPSDVNHHQSQVSISGPPFSPYYCWCPLSPPPLQYTVSPSSLPIASTGSLPLPPLSSFLASPGPPVSLIPSKLPIDVVELPSLNFPSLFPETLVCLPLPVPSLVTSPSSQQIPTFIPFMSDPIVHIPIIDVCSAGQGYLVSAGPGISSSIAPLLPSRTSPLIPETESVLEKSARETLRMLMASAPTFTNPQLMNMLPEAFNNTNENFLFTHASKHAAAVGGSRCLYSATLDVKAPTTGVSFMELSSSRGNQLAHGGSATSDELELDKHDSSDDLSKSTQV